MPFDFFQTPAQMVMNIAQQAYQKGKSQSEEEKNRAAEQAQLNPNVTPAKPALHPSAQTLLQSTPVFLSPTNRAPMATPNVLPAAPVRRSVPAPLPIPNSSSSPSSPSLPPTASIPPTPSIPLSPPSVANMQSQLSTFIPRVPQGQNTTVLNPSSPSPSPTSTPSSSPTFFLSSLPSQPPLLNTAADTLRAHLATDPFATSKPKWWQHLLAAAPAITAGIGVAKAQRPWVFPLPYESFRSAARATLFPNLDAQIATWQNRARSLSDLAQQEAANNRALMQGYNTDVRAWQAKQRAEMEQKNLERQLENDSYANALKQAQTNLANARRVDLTTPKPPTNAFQAKMQEAFLKMRSADEATRQEGYQDYLRAIQSDDTVRVVQSFPPEYRGKLYENLNARQGKGEDFQTALAGAILDTQQLIDERIETDQNLKKAQTTTQKTWGNLNAANAVLQSIRADLLTSQKDSSRLAAAVFSGVLQNNITDPDTAISAATETLSQLSRKHKDNASVQNLIGEAYKEIMEASVKWGRKGKGTDDFTGTDKDSVLKGMLSEGQVVPPANVNQRRR